MQISLNPITKANTEKALQRVIALNHLAAPSQSIASIAEAANGDLRNAMETLQLTCAGMPVTVAAGKAKKGAQVCSVVLSFGSILFASTQVHCMLQSASCVGDDLLMS